MDGKAVRADGLGRRVVVTGMAGFSPIGNDWASIEANLRTMQTGIRHMDDWAEYEGLNTRLGGPVAPLSCLRSTPAARCAAWVGVRAWRHGPVS